MAESLATKGHTRTLEQGQSKVKELQQAYTRVREHSSCSRAGPHSYPYFDDLHRILGGSEAPSPPPVVDMGLETPVVARAGVPAQEEEDAVSTVTTITLEPLPHGLDVSQASSKAGKGSSGEWS